ncbi:3-dehydroquinate synthase [Salipiger sp. CCB-MM3]|uniref:3-dehydroquinate synthase n=1 Tax=Salipiger sp. CCB-MM3 TaxID=1792508 RepID=UPI001F33208F|nr:3-dehydroquinate synthase [Salipiger sp. CCB-MM3]
MNDMKKLPKILTFDATPSSAFIRPAPTPQHEIHSRTQSFSVNYEYRVVFTRDLFSPANASLREALEVSEHSRRQRCLVFIDADVLKQRGTLGYEIARYFREEVPGVELACAPLAIEGGEAAKAGLSRLEQIYHRILEHGIDRHSYVLAIGGGAVLDAVGMAAATAHRGIRHIRIPTTVLSQNDSGVGVKTAVNFAGSKNFAGCFAPPWAVLNDFDFLATLPPPVRRSGLSEAVKVALIRDRDFFLWIEANAAELKRFEPEAEEYMIRRSAELHMTQIAHGGDPFERGSARPLDFGHWSAHKLETFTQYCVSHGDAVAMGIALDARYSVLTGLLAPGEESRIVSVLNSLGLPLWHPGLARHSKNGNLELLRGLEEFREHLGGKLTITLLCALGKGIEINEMRPDLVADAIGWLKRQAHAYSLASEQGQGQVPGQPDCIDRGWA